MSKLKSTFRNSAIHYNHFGIAQSLEISCATLKIASLIRVLVMLNRSTSLSKQKNNFISEKSYQHHSGMKYESL